MNVLEKLKEMIRDIKVRIAFIGHPNEPMNEAGPDWSKEVRLMDQAREAIAELEKVEPCKTCGGSK